MDPTARIELRQTYTNTHDTAAAELRYTAPLIAGATVLGICARFSPSARSLHGVVRRSQHAVDEYSDALAGGRRACLLQQAHADAPVEWLLGAVPPRESVAVAVVYAVVLDEFDAASHCFEELSCALPLRVVFPCSISPVLAPSAAPIATFSVEVANVLPSDLTNLPCTVSCLSHPHPAATVEARADLSVAVVVPLPLDRPLELLLHTSSCTPPLPARCTLPQCGDAPTVGGGEGGAAGCALYGSVLACNTAPAPLPLPLPHDGAPFVPHAALMVSVLPRLRLPCESPSAEMIFLVDRSASMAGSPINNVKKMLLLFLKSLPESCRFNIVGFGSRYSTLFPESTAYTERSLRVATKHVERLSANMGGTELLPPLRAIFGSAAAPRGVARHLFVLTDGEVSNTEDCIRCARDAAGWSLAVFGLGSGCDRSLVSGLARAANGAVEFIARDENIHAKVLWQLHRALRPAVANVRLSVAGIPPELRWAVVGRPPTSLRNFERFVVCMYFGFAGGDDGGGGADVYALLHNAELVLDGHLAAGAVCVAVGLANTRPLPPPPLGDDARTVDALVAHTVLHTVDSHCDAGDFALSHSLASRWTAFVAVEDAQSAEGSHLASDVALVELDGSWCARNFSGGYRAGLGRGAVGFTSHSSIGPSRSRSRSPPPAVRSLRLREDVARYLVNLQPEACVYDPKTRQMLQTFCDQSSRSPSRSRSQSPAVARDRDRDRDSDHSPARHHARVRRIASGSSDDDEDCSDSDGSTTAATTTTNNNNNNTAVLQLAALQCANGLWSDLEGAVAAMALAGAGATVATEVRGQILALADELQPQLPHSSPHALALVLTATVLQFLATHCADERAQWHLLALKASRTLATALARAPSAACCSVSVDELHDAVSTRIHISERK